MSEKTKSLRFTKLLATSSMLAAGATVLPVDFDVTPDGTIGVHMNAAFAKDGEGGEGGEGGSSGGESGSSGGSEGGESGSDGGGSGSEGGERSDSSGESGEAGERGDDSGEAGESGDDTGESGEGGERGDDDRSRDRGPKAEINGENIEVTFADGTKQEIEFGRFEAKDRFGNTIVERPATATDRAALESAAASLSSSLSGSVGTGGVARQEQFGNNIEVSFTDGTRQEIQNGRLEVKDQFGATIIERPATQSDFDRLHNGISTLR